MLAMSKKPSGYRVITNVVSNPACPQTNHGLVEVGFTCSSCGHPQIIMVPPKSGPHFIRSLTCYVCGERKLRFASLSSLGR